MKTNNEAGSAGAPKTAAPKKKRKLFLPNTAKELDHYIQQRTIKIDSLTRNLTKPTKYRDYSLKKSLENNIQRRGAAVHKLAAMIEMDAAAIEAYHSSPKIVTPTAPSTEGK